MKNILYYSPTPNDSTAFYRTSGVLPHINHRELRLTDVSHLKEFSWHNFVGFDTLIFQRPFSQVHFYVLQMAKDVGLRIILDYDDDLLNVDMYNPTYAQYQSAKTDVLKCLGMADMVWFSTVSIMESMGRYCKEGVVIPNAHNDYMFPVDKKRGFVFNKKCFYRGGMSHQADVNEKADVIIYAINTHTDWTFQFMGDRFTYLEQRCGDNYQIVPALPMFAYFKYLYDQNPCVGIFPLCDTQFNRGKSNIAWMEMTYAGAAVFGNTHLPEYIDGSMLPIEEMGAGFTEDVLEFYNRVSWEYIAENLLLSKINEKRIACLL